MLFRPNVARSSLYRLHVAVKSTTAAVVATSRRNFADINMKSVSSSSKKEGGGSSFVPSGLLRFWYNTFGQSTARVASFTVALIVVGEYTFQGGLNSLWTMNNYGRTFDTVDWGPFDEVDEEEEEEEEEEEDDDEE